MSITETPDKWVIIKVIGRDSKVYYKVFASWAGGYLDADSWKLNSGISKVDSDENFYFFYGFSGSCYKCRKTSYGVATSYTNSILEKLLGLPNELYLQEDSDNWLKLNEI